MSTRQFKITPIIIGTGTLGLLLLSGCVSLHPRVGTTSPANTAYPPETPARPPEKSPTIEYKHQIREEESRKQTNEIPEKFSALYKKSGSPKFTYVFVAGQKIIHIEPAHRAIFKLKSDTANATLTAETKETRDTGSLPDWALAEQGVYEILNDAGIDIVDYDLTTLSNADEVFKNIDSGLSIETSKLKSVLNSSAEVVLIYQLLDFKETTKLVGRIIDLKDNFALIVRKEVEILTDTEEQTHLNNLLWKSKTKTLTIRLLQAWVEKTEKVPKT